MLVLLVMISIIMNIILLSTSGLIGLIMYRSKKTENFRKYKFFLYLSCFSVKIFGYEADKIIRRPHRFLFFIFKLFYLLKCNARHTGFLDFCHTRLHLGYSARLRIWQVPACKMEPRSGIIFLLKTHPPPQHLYS